jgi:hypothetical protein
MICGFGWTGSGAIHDALSGADCFCEFPAADPDPYLHPDALSELAFVQEPAGLGRIWRQARDKGIVDTQLLWDLLRLHVLRLGGIGYTEHKSTNAARSLVRRFGLRYSRTADSSPDSSPGSAQCGSRTRPENRQASRF